MGEGGNWGRSIHGRPFGFSHMLFLEKEQEVTSGQWKFSFRSKKKVLFNFWHLFIFLNRLEYKYSRLVMSANKDCELPAADSCALAEGEGEENEDDVVYSNTPSLLGKLKAIASKVSYLLRVWCHHQILCQIFIFLHYDLKLWCR